MKIIHSLQIIIIILVLASCNNRNTATTESSTSMTKLETVDALKAEFKKRRQQGAASILELAYKHDQISEDMLAAMKSSMKSEEALKIREIRVEKFDDSSFEKSKQILAGRGLKMPVKPTQTMTIAYDTESKRETGYGIAKIDGGYYLIFPVKMN